MVRLRLNAAAVSQSRFALSPLAETLGSVLVLGKDGPAKPWLASWYGRHHTDFLAGLDGDPFAIGLVRLLATTKWIPRFVAIPPPGGMRTTLDDELAAVAAMPDALVRTELELSVANSWLRHDLDWLTGHSWGARTSDMLRSAWRAYVFPEWPGRRAVLEREITYRSGVLAREGWPPALRHMARRSAWVGSDTIQFGTQDAPDRIVGDAGMLFVPVTHTSGSWLCEAPPDRRALVYPARGFAVEDREPVDTALERLIGHNRAAILRELERPATTSELATLFDLSLGTVGGHLTVLRDAGLITGTRMGRRVTYRRTEAGDLLIAINRGSNRNHNEHGHHIG
ncbi:ArsR/SmtB family transcription factor [Nocardia spumae]|uniref:ArsR/SmtB family transcription factor n=1 Tax=Nocardia spumae TaxID=2887190 RepID=UPI001D14A988|nr:winged helix-turn-helix domain-containing protein [Nocardia spumae]